MVRTRPARPALSTALAARFTTGGRSKMMPLVSGQCSVIAMSMWPTPPPTSQSSASRFGGFQSMRRLPEISAEKDFIAASNCDI